MLHGWKEDSMHRSMCPSIFNRLRAIARYWSEIATFSIPLHLMPPLGMFPLEFREKVWPHKTRIMGLPGSEDSLTIGWAVSTQYQGVTDGQTDGQTDGRTNVQPIAITLKSRLLLIFTVVIETSLIYLLTTEVSKWQTGLSLHELPLWWSNTSISSCVFKYPSI